MQTNPSALIDEKISKDSGYLFNTDVNTLTIGGLYGLATGNSNLPLTGEDAEWGTLYVNGNAGVASQIYISRNNVAYHRRLLSGTWSAWKKVVTHDGYTTVTTTLGTCSYNDEWIVYQVTGDVVVNMSAWTQQQVDTLPVGPKFQVMSEGYATNYNGTFAAGFFRIATDGKVYYETRDTPLINNTTPLTKYYLMPRK